MAGDTRAEIILSAVNQTQQAFGEAKRDLDKIASAVGSARAAFEAMLAIVGVASFGAMIKGASESADAAAKMGDRFGLATERMIGLQAAGELFGASKEGIARALKDLSGATFEAATKGGEAAASFDRLKISASTFATLPMDEQFIRVTEALANVQNATERNALGAKLLGKSWGEVSGAMAEGAEGIREAMRDAQLFGLAINRVDAAKLEAVNDAITKSHQAMQGLFTTIAINLAPVVIALKTGFIDAMRANNGFRDSVADGMEKVVTAVAYGANVVQGLRFAWVAAKLVVAEFVDFVITGMQDLAVSAANSGLMKFISYMPGPVGVAAKAFRGLGEDGDSSLKLLSETTQQVAAEIKAELNGIAEQGLPMEKMIAAYRAAVQRLDDEAQRAAAKRQKFLSEGGPTIKLDDDAWMRDLAQRTAQIQIANLSEIEQLTAHLMQKRNVLELARKENLIGADEANRQERAAEIAHQAALSEVAEFGIHARRNFSANAVTQRVAQIQQSLMSEQQLEGMHYAQRQNDLVAALQQERMTNEEFNASMEALTIVHQGKLAAIELRKHEAVRNMERGTWQLAGELMQQFAGKSRAAALVAIAISKGLAMAQVLQQTAAARMQIMADPTLLAPMKPAALANLEAMSATQLGLIAATGLAQAANVGSGGASLGSPANPVSTTSAGSSAPASAPAPGGGVTNVINVHVNGNVIGNEAWINDELIPAMAAAINVNDVVLIQQTSRQAMVLATS